MNRLTRKFFERKTLTVAKDLLGKILVRKIGTKEFKAVITETEAYCGENDLASHARFGKTQRNRIMWGPAGHAYIYFIYGMHYCLNIVTQKEDKAGAVLIRGIRIESQVKKREPSKSNCDSKFVIRDSIVSGPGRVCKFLKIDKLLNGEDLTIGRRLWIKDCGIKIESGQIKRMPRVGVNYAGKYKDKTWRFMIR